ncbi:hypothetical protein WAF17_07545 [Bernardetia sp. ABR2-2B]|uniref:hypothetical protein n=1 Tax=Bernardetia sp. ABR2-2B TaxID=3127472 RepID=UPI0030CFA9FD
MKSLYYISVIYLVIVTIIHIITLVVIDTSFLSFSFMFVCQIGCMGLIGYGLAVGKRGTEEKPSIFGVFKGLPSYISKIAIGVVVYVALLISFFIYSAINVDYDTKDGVTAVYENKIYQLQNRYGKFIKNITEEEYHLYNTRGKRIFSAVWIVIGGMATASFYKTYKSEEINEDVT